MKLTIYELILGFLSSLFKALKSSMTKLWSELTICELDLVMGPTSVLVQSLSSMTKLWSELTIYELYLVMGPSSVLVQSLSFMSKLWSELTICELDLVLGPTSVLVQVSAPCTNCGVNSPSVNSTW